ncbi:TonB-dependent receptor [Dyella jiangningensis]|uniref:TonB-dependent receptor n=2 Tax=Gammaproteobacteria TaxID=1236 RepID=UPI000881EC37|nr:TonB-dependent receptor [Dyella sp. AtDHG13]PXV53165.1 TonB-dependent receptor [Dyella sp. AtDHG13]SDL44567.1 TonB-dependent receptor [Dyella jiangningensis]
MNCRRSRGFAARSIGARRPLAIACIAALLAATGMPALAQQTQDQPTATTPPNAKAAPTTAKPAKPEEKPAPKSENRATNLDAIVVTGIAGSIENALKTKENANNIVEAISAEDIGKLPDASIAESLARLPGLATQRVDGRADQISIRGLSPDFAGTTLNGREQATIGENRGVEFDQYPAELISGAVVYKTPDASLIGQGLSGTMDLHTLHPLDLPNRAIAANLRGEYTTNGKQNPGTDTGNLGHRASFSYVDQFLDHTLGLAVGFAQLDSPIQEKQYQAWWWSKDNGPGSIEDAWGGPHTPGMPDNVISQEGMQLRAQSENQLRNGLMAVLEWAPNDWYHGTLDTYYSTFNEKKYTNGVQWASGPYDNAGAAVYSNVGTVPASPYPIVTTGSIANIRPILQNEYTKEHDKLFSVGWNNQFTFGNGWEAMADLSYSSAKKDLHDAYLFAGIPNQGTTGVQFATPQNYGFPNFQTGANLADPSAIQFTDPDDYGYNGRQEFDHQDDHIKAIRLQVSHPVGWIFSTVDVGVNYSDRKKTKSADVEFAWLNGNGSSGSAYDPAYSVPVNPAFLYGSTNIDYGGIGRILNYNVLGALANQFYLTSGNKQNDWARNYSVEEKVPVGYVKFNIDTMLGDIPLRGNAGVQFVHTDQSSVALQTNGDNLVAPISGGTTYNNVLPSLNLIATIGDKQYLRFGLAKTMARGRIDDEKVATSASLNQVESGPAAGQYLWSGSGGNPNLKPYVAVGTDLSWEKYFGKASYVAVAVFNKNLLNYIYNQTVLNYDFSKYTNDDPTHPPSSNIGSFTTPENGTGGRMEGLELSGSLEGGLVSRWLDGFGMQGNFSLTNSSVPVSSVTSIPGAPSTLPGLSRKVANLTLYYEKYGWSFRITERYRSSFTGEAVALFDQLGYQKVLADKQTDFQAGYAFTQGSWNGLSVLLQVYNLTNSPYKTQQISSLPDNEQIARPLDYNTWGRTVMFGLNYKL